jgi:GWxTD domain-containing protein
VIALHGKVALAVFAVLAPGAPTVPKSPETVKVHAVRFYDSGSGLTQVRAFIQIPLEALTPTSQSADGMVSYRVSVRLRDSSGMVLSEDAWPSQHVSATLLSPGLTTVNSVEFVVRPGRYRLEVNVVDSVSGTHLQAGADLLGYQQAPSASDLVLSPGMRALSTDSAPQGTEWRSGSLLVTSAAELILTPLRSKAYYLLEAYSATPDSGSMAVTIRDSLGKTVVSTPPVRVQVGAGGGVLRGQLDMEGLPAGRYALEVAVELGQQKVQRSGTFVMTDVVSTLARRAAGLNELAGTDSGFFSLMDEVRLDAAFEPLAYIAGGGDLRAFRGASIGAKRQFMINFWRKRDPDPATPRNEIREEFYGKIAYADNNFRERGSRTQSGWKTDRGRIYTRLGAPDETLDRVRSGQAPSYLVWRYTRGKGLYFVFSDRSGLGAYKLMITNDLLEAGSPDWRDILGPDATRDIGYFLGVDFFASTTNR